MSKNYFQSEEFKEILQSYEKQKGSGSVYLDAEDFADIADYYLNEDLPGQAMEAIATGLSVHPEEEVLRVVKSAACIYMHEFDRAEKLLDGLDAFNSDVKYQKAQILYAKYTNITAAEETWNEWMEQEAEEFASPEMAREAYIHIISSLTELHDIEGPENQECHEAVSRWIRKYIERFQPLGKYEEDEELVEICKDNNFPGLMAVALSQVLEEKPYLPKGWSNLALAQFLVQQYEQALDSCAFALAIDANDLDALLTKAHTLNAMGEKIASGPVFKEYLERGGEAVQAIPYAEVLFMDGKRDEAIQQLKWMETKLVERLNEAEQGLRDARMKKNKLAIDMAEAYYSDNYDLAQKIYGDIGDLYHHNGLYEESIRVNEKVLEMNKTCADAHFALGINYLALKRYEAATQSFANALQWADDQVMMGVDIALTFVLNDFDKFALEVLNAIAQVADKSDSPFVRNISTVKSLIYLKLGEIAQFHSFFKTACEENPNLVAQVYEGLFPPELPVSKWGKYAEDEFDTLMEEMKNKKLPLMDF